MYCTKCGMKVPDESRRCPHCGCDLSYERDALKNAPPRKSGKRPSHAGTVITILVFLAAVMEIVWFFGISPRRIRTVSQGPAPEMQDGQGVVDLIPTFSSEPSAAAVPEEEEEVPTPTLTVTPKSSAGTEAIGLPQPTAPPASAPEEAQPEESQTEILPAAEETEEPVPEETEEPEPEATEEPEEPEEPEYIPITEEPEPTDNSYLLPNSSDEEISASQLEGMSEAEARIARNEIYARHGLIFKSEDLQEYFSQQEWYHGTVEDVDSIDLTETEAENIEAILQYEAANGYNQG